MGTVVSSDIQHPCAVPEAPIAAASAAAVASTKDTTSHRPASVESIAKVAAAATQTPAMKNSTDPNVEVIDLMSSSSEDEDDDENDAVVAVSSPRPLAPPPLLSSSSSNDENAVTTTKGIKSSGDLLDDTDHDNKVKSAAAAPSSQPVNVRDVPVVPTPLTTAPAEDDAAAAADLGPTLEPTSTHKRNRNALERDNREAAKNHSATEIPASNENASGTRHSVQIPPAPVVPLPNTESPLDSTNSHKSLMSTPRTQVTNTPTTVGFSNSGTDCRPLSPTSLERQFDAALRQSCQLHPIDSIPIDSFRASPPPLPQRRRVRQACRNEQKREPTKRKVTASNEPEQQDPSKRSRIEELASGESTTVDMCDDENAPATTNILPRPPKPAHEVPSRRLGTAALSLSVSDRTATLPIVAATAAAPAKVPAATMSSIRDESTSITNLTARPKKPAHGSPSHRLDTVSVLETATEPILATTAPSATARAATLVPTTTTTMTTAMTKSDPVASSKDSHHGPATNRKRTSLAVPSSDPVSPATIASPTAGANVAALQKKNENASRIKDVPADCFPTSDHSAQNRAVATTADTAASPKSPKSYEDILLDTWDGGVQANLEPLLQAVTVDNVNVATSKAGWTALMIACGLAKTAASSVLSTTVIEALITTFHANVRATDVDGWNCFHWAMFHGHRAAISQLIKSINDETIVKECCRLPDRDGKTPLDIARQEGFGDLISLLPNAVTSLATQPNSTTWESQDFEHHCDSGGDDYDDSERTLGAHLKLSETSPTTILDSRSLAESVVPSLEPTDETPSLPRRPVDDPLFPLLPTNELASKCWKCWVVLKPMDPAKDDGPCLFTTHLHVVLDVRVCSVCAEEVAAIEQSTDCDEKHTVCAGCAMGEDEVDSTFFLCDTENCERVFCRTCVAQAEASGAEGWEKTKATEESDELWHCPVCRPPDHLIKLRKMVQEDVAKEAQAETRSAEFLLDLLARAEAEKEQCETDSIDEDDNETEYLRLLELRLADFISNLLDELEVKHSLSAAMCYMYIGMPLPKVARLDDPDPDQPWFRDADQEVRRRIQERRSNAQEISTYPADVYEKEDYNDVEELGPEDTTSGSLTAADRQGFSRGVRPTETELRLAWTIEQNLNIEVRQAPSDSADNDEILVDKERATDGVARREFKRRRQSWIGVPKPISSRVSPSLDPRVRTKSPNTASLSESALPTETELVEGVDTNRLPTSTNNGPSTNKGPSTDNGSTKNTSSLGVSPARAVGPNSQLRLCVKGEMSDHNLPNVRSISVNPTLAKILKAHQSEGVHFMFRNCFSDFAWSLEGDAKQVGGCVLAHSMGLVSKRTAYAYFSISEPPQKPFRRATYIQRGNLFRSLRFCMQS
jgi:hypothetical protein